MKRATFPLRRALGVLLACAVLLAGLMAGLASVAAADGWRHDRADLSTLVVVGDSISAGHQNSSLMATQQVHGFASLIAEQAGVPLPLPLIGPPGFPPVLELKDPGPPPVVGPVEAAPGTRINPGEVVQNLSVPGARTQDALVAYPPFEFWIPGFAYPYWYLQNYVLTSQGVHRSQVEWAEALHPTTAILWLGSNDVLWSAILADPMFMTDPATFKAAYAEVIDRLDATGATLLVANIPDVTVIPYLTSADDVADLLGVPLEAVGPALGIGPGDTVTPSAFELIQGILAGQIPGPLPGNVVLTGDEVMQVRMRTAEFNRFISRQAAEHHATLVDIAGLLDYVDTFGLVIGGQRLTTDFLGGVFTLDGIHPTNTAHAVVANKFIHALNKRHHARIPPVSLVPIMQDDPLAIPGTGHPARSLRSLNHDAKEILRGHRWH